VSSWKYLCCVTCYFVGSVNVGFQVISWGAFGFGFQTLSFPRFPFPPFLRLPSVTQEAACAPFFYAFLCFNKLNTLRLPLFSPRVPSTPYGHSGSGLRTFSRAFPSPHSFDSFQSLRKRPTHNKLKKTWGEGP